MLLPYQEIELIKNIDKPNKINYLVYQCATTSKLFVFTSIIDIMSLYLH